MSKSIRRVCARFLAAVFGATFLRFEPVFLAADFLVDGRFLLDVFFFAFGAFFFVTFLARAFLLVFFFFAGFLFVTFFLLTRFLVAGAFFFLDAFLAGFFFDDLRFVDGRAAFFATRFLAAGFFRAAFLRLGFFLAAAFLVGIDFASDGRVRKTRDYTEVYAERNTLIARVTVLG